MTRWNVLLAAFLLLPIGANAAQITTDEFSKEIETRGTVIEEKGADTTRISIRSFQDKLTKQIRDNIYFYQISNTPLSVYHFSSDDETLELKVEVLRRVELGCSYSANCISEEEINILLPPKYLERRHGGFRIKIVGNKNSKIIAIQQKQVDEIFSAQGRQPSRR